MNVHHWVPQPVLSLMIFVLWLALTNAESFASALGGVALALAIPHYTRRFWPDPPRAGRPVAALRLLVVVLWDIAVASLKVAQRVVGPLARLRPAFVEVPLDIRNPFVATILGSIVSLTPGTVSVDVDRKRWVLAVHTLDVDDPVALVATIKTRYERPLKEIFGC